jgi:repressor LexA
MIDAGINDGDIVYVQQQPDAENGQIVVAMVGDETTLKRFYRSGDAVTLMPANAKYAPIILSGEALSDLRILGRAVGFTRWI